MSEIETQVQEVVTEDAAEFARQWNAAVEEPEKPKLTIRERIEKGDLKMEHVQAALHQALDRVTREALMNGTFEHRRPERLYYWDREPVFDHPDPRVRAFRQRFEVGRYMGKQVIVQNAGHLVASFAATCMPSRSGPLARYRGTRPTYRSIRERWLPDAD